MKRSRPRQHVRRMSSGKKVVVNKGVMKKAKRRMIVWPSQPERNKIKQIMVVHDGERFVASDEVELRRKRLESFLRGER